MCVLFEVCEKRPFQKGMSWGGGLGCHIFEHQSYKEDAPHRHALNIADTFIPNRRHLCCLFQAGLGPGFVYKKGGGYFG